MSKEKRPTVPGLSQQDISKLRRCGRTDTLLDAAIARSEINSMEARDYKRWNSLHYVRRWSRNDDGIKALVASSQELDIYWSSPWDGRTQWRIVQRELVDGFIQTTMFDSVGIEELRAMALSAKEAAILRNLPDCLNAAQPSRPARQRL